VEVRLRPLMAEDMALVYRSWIGTAEKMRMGSRGAPVAKSALTNGVHARISRLVARDTGLAIVPRETPASYMLGFVCADPERRALHMLYVMGKWRRLGIATDVLRQVFDGWPDVPIVFTQDTPAMGHLRKKWNASYNPYLCE
jgi:hypothetical protein